MQYLSQLAYIMGAKFGTASYLWIVLGSIFAGAVHDYLAGMLSLRHDGESLPEIIGRYLGLTTKQVCNSFQKTCSLYKKTLTFF